MVESIHGSILVVRCLSYGIVCIAAAAVVASGYWFLVALAVRLRKRAVPDDYQVNYGGRLRGGGKLAAVSGPTVRELFPSPFGREVAQIDNACADSQKRTRVDPDRLEIGDEFSFVYNGGHAPGTRKTCVLKSKNQTVNGLQLKCLEQIVDGKPRLRTFWPSRTAEARYSRSQPEGSGSV